MGGKRGDLRGPRSRNSAVDDCFTFFCSRTQDLKSTLLMVGIAGEGAACAIGFLAVRLVSKAARLARIGGR